MLLISNALLILARDSISNSWLGTLHTNIKQSIAAKHFREYTATLFLDDAAGDPSARISGWVGFVVVRGCVNHDSSAAVVEERIRAAAERDAHRMQGCFTCTIGCDFEIQQITSVRTIRIVFAVFLHVRVEVASRSGERRAFALADGVNVNSVSARRHFLDIHQNANSIGGGRDSGSANLTSLRVHNIYVR